MFSNPYRLFAWMILCALLVAPTVVSATVSCHVAFDVAPASPHADAPFQVTFGGSWPFTKTTAPATVRVEDDTIQIVQEAHGPPPILPDFEPFVVTGTVGPLTAGTYRVQFLVHPPGAPDAEPLFDCEETIEIVPASSIRALQAHPALPSDYFLSVTSRVRFEAEVFASCALLEPARVLAESRTIEVPVAFECSILPPSPTLMSFEMEEDLDLDAGTWTVRLVDDDATRTLAASTFEVLPYPVILRDGRFEVEVEQLDQDFPAPALPVSTPSVDSALFWFFEPTNWELMLKVLDGCAINGHYWVFGAAQTDRGYRIRVRDTLTDETWEIENFAGTPSPAITDTTAFATCP